MEPGIIIVLLILIVTVIMLVLYLLRIDIVAIGCMPAPGRTGILNPQEMFSGFPGNAVIAMHSVMIPGWGIAHTGICCCFGLRKQGFKKKFINFIYF